MQYLTKEMKEKAKKRKCPLMNLYYEAPGLCIVPEEDGCGDSKSETDGEQADEEGARQGPDNS